MESSNLRDVGLKVTLPRLKILQMLETHPARHMSAEDIYRKLIDSEDDIGLATVYRVLTQFETAGLVKRHHFEGGHAVFELERGHHHDHMVCIKCGHVTEFEDDVIERRQKEKAQELGFRLQEHSLIMYGDCLREQCTHLKSPAARRMQTGGSHA
jgi:Fur family ferric uptake transcriptional regulator